MAVKPTIIHTLQFWVLWPFMKALELLPWTLAYGLGCIISFLLHHLISYRKKVIAENLRLSFPQLAEKERGIILKNNYLYLGKLLVESFKSPALTAEFLHKNIQLDAQGIAVLKEASEKYKRVMIVSGHCGNWEWSGHLLAQTKFFSFYSLYKPLSNPWFDNWIREPRSQFGLQLIDMNQTTRALLTIKEPKAAVVFIADQAPDPQGAYTNLFLNQETQWFTGPEKLSKKLGWPVIFSCCSLNEKGQYQLTAQWITQNPKEEPENQITQKLSEYLEAEIKAHPHNWLWSHKRWKHTRKT